MRYMLIASHLVYGKQKERMNDKEFIKIHERHINDNLLECFVNLGYIVYFQKNNKTKGTKNKIWFTNIMENQSLTWKKLRDL